MWPACPGMHTEASPPLPGPHLPLFAAWGCPSFTCSVEYPDAETDTQILFSPAFSAHPPHQHPQLEELGSRGVCIVAQQCLLPLALQVLALCVTLSVTMTVSCVTPQWGGGSQEEG